MKAQRLGRPLSIESVQDGIAYALPPGVRFAQTNLFLNVACADQLYIKTPSERGLADYRRFVKSPQPHPEEIRSPESQERFDNRADALTRFPELASVAALDEEIAHYLVVHKLQYERLRDRTTIGIPQARFGVICDKRLGLFDVYKAALFQQRIAGTTLWRMFDFAAWQVASSWRPLLPTIAQQINELLRSGLETHVDWNIQNFVFNEAETRLYYVDMKPTTFLSRESNEKNLKGIRDHFGI